MGSRGPAPKPAEMRALEGGKGKGGRDLSHRPAKDSPKYAPLADEAPDWMPKEGRAEWRRLMKEFGRYPDLVQRPDREAMIALCMEWDLYLSSARERADKDTRPKARQEAHYRARDALAKLQVMWARFGMTPGDRARFNLDKQGGEDDPILKLLTGGGKPSD
jgi:P27 family predicted phage terminase small subunit